MAEAIIFNSFDDFINNMPEGTSVDDATLKAMSQYQNYYNAIRNEQYVTIGSKLGCTGGTQLSLINLNLDYGITVENGLAVLINTATMVGTFGKCKKKGNAKLQICFPNVTGEWQARIKGNNTYIWDEGDKKYHKVLTEEAVLPCSHGGCISVLEVPGQYEYEDSLYDVNGHKVDARALKLMNKLHDKYPSVQTQRTGGGLCIFGLEGLGWLSGKGNSTLYPMGRYGAMMVVTIGDKVKFVTYHASTLPGKLRGTVEGTAIVDEDCYYIEGKRHQGYYAAFGCKTEGRDDYLPVKRADMNKNILLSFKDDGKTRLKANGVNIHTAPDNVGDLYSTACQTIRTEDYIPFLYETGLVNRDDSMAAKLNGMGITSSIMFRGENAYPTWNVSGEVYGDANNNPYTRDIYGMQQFSDLSTFAIDICIKKRQDIAINRKIALTKEETDKDYYWYMELLCGMNVNTERTGYYVLDRSYMPEDQKTMFFL